MQEGLFWEEANNQEGERNLLLDQQAMRFRSPQLQRSPPRKDLRNK
jgi:hypothetical protein